MLSRKTLLLFCFLLLNYSVFAGIISGIVKDNKGEIIPYATIIVNAKTSISADANGVYSLHLEEGKYQITCSHIGYVSISKNVEVTSVKLQLDFVMNSQESELADVVIQSKDPSDKIVQHTIDNRTNFLMPYNAFSCQAYIKMLMKTRKMPKKILFTKVDHADKKEMGVDSAGKGVVYLSESISNVAFGKPDKIKSEVISSRESGSQGYGFAFPTYVNIYQENIDLLKDAGNKRGFISPVSDNAFHYYKFKYGGSYTIGNEKIHRIKVIPKRKYEPLFSGTIDIVDNDWHIYSTDLYLTKASSIELFDTVRIRQQYEKFSTIGWLQKQQILDFSMKILGIDLYGNVLDDYSKYSLDPKVKFDNVLITFQDSSKNRNANYWDSVRPVLLTAEESLDYHKKDSAFFARKDSLLSKHYSDSLHAKYNKFSIGGLLFSGGVGKRFYDDSNHITSSFSIDPLIKKIQYNTVEGIAFTWSGNYSKYFKNQILSFAPSVRYGFHNQHLNPNATLTLSKRFKSNYSSSNQQFWYISGGKSVNQYNGNEPISPLINSIYTLFWGENYMKIYEKYYTNIGFYKRSSDGWTMQIFGKYEDRRSINNTTDYSFRSPNYFTPNYPVDLISSPQGRNKAVIVGFNVSYQPGQTFIQYPNGKESLGSTKPTYSLSYQKGIHGLLGSDVNYDKWSAAVSNSWDWKLGGTMKYKFSIGGFLNNKDVFIQDMTHFMGDQTLLANSYVSGFQLAPYYLFSNADHFYITGHLEHHFNGLLTNKIPFFNTMHWNLVAGANAFYVNKDNRYVEVFGGLENIFKILRVDFVKSFATKDANQFGVRIGIGGIF